MLLGDFRKKDFDFFVFNHFLDSDSCRHEALIVSSSQDDLGKEGLQILQYGVPVHSACGDNRVVQCGHLYTCMTA